MADMYAWSEIRNGGEVDEVKTSGGGTRNVITKRNSVDFGEKVSKAKLKCSDEEWDALVESKVVREYPPPEEVDEFLSPTQAILARITKRQTGELDQDMILELALKHPPALPTEEEEESDLPEGA